MKAEKTSPFKPFESQLEQQTKMVKPQRALVYFGKHFTKNTKQR